MKTTRLTGILSFLLSASILSTNATGHSQVPIKHNFINLPVNSQTAVRFFFLPPNSYLHPALIFRVAGLKSEKLNTAPIVNLGGRTPYISIDEMRRLVQLLNGSGLSWMESPRFEKPGMVSFKETTGRLEIKVFTSAGTASSVSDPARLCDTLASLDTAFKQPRALWEFQLFRVEYKCIVPGFNRMAFPQHDDPKSGN